MNPGRLKENLEAVRSRISVAALRSGRSPEDVRLVTVTKRVGPEVIPALVELDELDLGENYPQELWRKAETFRALPIRWHHIGHLQGNKAKRTIPTACLLHGVDSLKLLKTVEDIAIAEGLSPSVCLQVNASGEESKHGWSPEGLLADAEAIASLSTVSVVGLMTMAALAENPEAARPSFATLRELRDEFARRSGIPLRHLSMGMSHDFDVAIEEGATLIRVGSAIFEGVET